MQLLLGLFFFSILVTTGHSVQCVKCRAINGYCPLVKEDCPEGSVCMIEKLKSKDGKYNVTRSGCALESKCKEQKEKIGEELLADSVDGVPIATVVESIVCSTDPDILKKVSSKAPPFFASFFSAFLGLLLMKLLL